MPAYCVSSGDFSLNLVRSSPLEAADDAFCTLKNGNFHEMKLGLLTQVALLFEEDEEGPIFMSTLLLVERHGLNYHRT